MNDSNFNDIQDAAIDFEAEITVGERSGGNAHIPPGEYEFRVAATKRERVDATPKIIAHTKYSLQLDIMEGGEKIGQIIDSFPLRMKMVWKLDNLFVALGLIKRGEKYKVGDMFDRIVGEIGKCKLDDENYVNKKGEEKTISRATYLDPESTNNDTSFETDKW